jgi:hypothetical protein
MFDDDFHDSILKHFSVLMLLVLAAVLVLEAFTTNRITTQRTDTTLIT